MESDFEDDHEICYTSKRRAHPLLPQYDEDSYPSSSWANTNELDDDQRSSSIDYYHEEDQLADELFQLPASSNDLSLPARPALHLATIYEFLRHFSSILRLTPFLFEHFCTALIESHDRNNLLFSQIHICLLRLLIKQDDDDGITYASETDIKGIVDLSFVTMDYLTWPYILQLYVHSHPQLKHLSPIVKEYPFRTNLEEKINLLLALCDLTLTTKIIRREFDDTKPKQHDDNCRQCQKRGDLLCCDRCEATYHLTCLNPPLTCVPTVEWLCPVCVQNQIHGVTNCIPPREHRPFYLRHRCIGHDREQRRYWFVCRRLFVEDEFGEDVRYYSNLEQFDALLASLDERGPEKLLVYRLQKRYADIARCMQITADLHLSVPFDEEPEISPAMFTDGLMPCSIDEPWNQQQDYQHLVEAIQLRKSVRTNHEQMPGQIDGICDEDDDERHRKPLAKKREFFIHANHHQNGFPSSKLNGHNYLMPVKRKGLSLEDQLRQEHNISAETRIVVQRLNEEDIAPSIWQRYERYQVVNRYPSSSHTTSHRGTPAYPRSNYYRDYYTGTNYEDEDGMQLDNEYDDFGDDFFQQEENVDELDMPFRKYESSRVYRGTTRGRPRGRGRPPLYGRTGGRTSHSGHPPRGVNHLTTGSFQSHQRLIQPKIESSKPTSTTINEAPAKNKRKPAKVKPNTSTLSEEKPRRPGKILRSGRISRKPRRDSETDFGSDNSDDSGAKNKESGSDDDEEFNLNQLGLPNAPAMINKVRDGSSSSTDSLATTNLPLTNFAAFAQSQLLATNLANGMMNNVGELSPESEMSSDGFESDRSDDILSEAKKKSNEIDQDEDENLDDFTYSQTMLSLINSIQPEHCSVDLELVPQRKDKTSPTEGHLSYENFYQTNPLATRKQTLLHERDRRAHLARKFSINHSPSFSWYSPLSSLTSNYSFKDISQILRVTLVHFENTIPLPFMHSRWRKYRYIWAKQLLDLEKNLSLKQFIALLLQFETCIKPVSYFDLFTEQVGYLKFRRETEKERDEAKKEEKDALIRRKIDADSIIQTVHFTRPLKHSVHRQRGEEYRLAGGQGWIFIRSTRRSIPTKKKSSTFNLNSLLTRREHLSNAVIQERQRILNLLETKLKTDLPNESDIEQEMKKFVSTAKDDNDDYSEDLTFISYKIVDYNGIQYRYPIMSEDTRHPFHLPSTKKTDQNTKKTNPFQLPVPWTFSYDNQAANIFILPSYVLRRLARASMNLTDAPGFLNSRLSGIGTRFGWPYPCGRPSVRTAWSFKVQTSTSFFAIAHHLKYLWNCIRWELLTEKLSSIDESSITTQVDQDGITTAIQVLAKRDSGPSDSYCEYFVRKTISSQTNENSFFNTIPISKSRSRAVPHPSSILTPNRLILTEQWLPERQLQPNQIKYYYQCLQDKVLKRLYKKTHPERKTMVKKPVVNQNPSTAKPFIVRIPHLQPKSALNTETGKVVLVKSNNDASTPQPATKSFSVVKLADGQIILVPTKTNPSSPPAPVTTTPAVVPSSTSPQDRRLRLIAPSPNTMTNNAANDLLTSILAQQQQQLLLQQQVEFTLPSEPVKVEVEPASTVVSPPVPKIKNVRKSMPVVHNPIIDEKPVIPKDEPKPVEKKAAKRSIVRPKIDPEDAIRMKICEALLRSLVTKIDREHAVAAARARQQQRQNSTPSKTSQKHHLLTRLLNERVDVLRQEFIGDRLQRKTVLVKEQVQTQRLKQQQLILKQQQATTTASKDETSSDKTNSSPPSAKKIRKSSTNESKTKRARLSKVSEKTSNSTKNKRTRPLPSTTEDSTSKKLRESSDNDENLVQQDKSTSNSPTSNAKMKSTEKPKKIITIKNSSSKKSQMEMNLSDINCICEQNDLQEKFFIQCELCSRWLHGKCVGLNPRQVEKLPAFICQSCTQLTQRAKERLYCLCQQPYDESKFYIGCDVCADWLHGSCVHLTPDEAEKCEVYVCPRCSTEQKQGFLNQPIDTTMSKQLLDLIEQLLTHKMAWPFQKPVDVKDVPNYYKIIKDPMDLTTLKSKVINSKYETLCDFIRDVNKIFNNCRQFNPINSTFSQCANVVDNYFRQLLEQMMMKNDEQ